MATDRHPQPSPEDTDWSTLVGKIQNKLCTPILGAGAAHSVLPLGSELAEELLVEEEAFSGKKAPFAERGDLSRVTEYIAVQRRDNFTPKLKLAEHLKRRGAPDFTSVGEPHSTLAALKLPIYITTNYDDFMYQALRIAGADPVREVARWNSELMEEQPSAFDTGYEPTAEKPVVFHIHGHWDIPGSMVATQDDYFDFLVSIARDLSTSPTDITKKVILPPRIRRALKSTTLLFVGYSLADVNFRVMLRGLRESLSLSSRQMSLSVQYCSPPPGALESYIEDYFGQTMNLHVFWYAAQQFCQSLTSRLAAARAEAARAGALQV